MEVTGGVEGFSKGVLKGVTGDSLRFFSRQANERKTFEVCGLVTERCNRINVTLFFEKKRKENN